MMWRPKFHLTTNKSLVQYKFVGGGWFPVLLGAVMITAIYLPYFIVLIRGTLNPILPFVSQAAGSPPQSGVFSVLISLSALLSFIGMHLLHMTIRLYNERIQIKNSRHVVDLLNKAILIPGHIGIMGMLIVGGYPIDYHRNSEDWMMVTILPHLIGAGSLFIGGIFYCILFTYIMSVIHPEKEELRSTRLTLIAIIVFCAALHAATVHTAFFGLEYNDPNRLKSCVMKPVEYDTHYVICSICEWVLLTAFVSFFVTIREEAKHFSLTMVITLDPPGSESSEKLKETSTAVNTIQKTSTCKEDVKTQNLQEICAKEESIISNGHM